MKRFVASEKVLSGSFGYRTFGGYFGLVVDKLVD